MSPLCFCVAAYINVSSGKIPPYILPRRQSQTCRLLLPLKKMAGLFQDFRYLPLRYSLCWFLAGWGISPSAEGDQRNFPTNL